MAKKSFSYFMHSLWEISLFLNYKDELQQLYSLNDLYLFDWNLRCFEWVNQRFKKNIEVTKFEDSSDIRTSKCNSEEYFPNNYNNLSKQPFIEYRQVFDDRQIFFPNVSILDLLFNVGPRFISF